MVAISTFLTNTAGGTSLTPGQHGDAPISRPSGLSPTSPNSSLGRFDTAMQQAGSVVAQPAAAPGIKAPQGVARSDENPAAFGETYGTARSPNSLQPTYGSDSQTLERQRALRGLDLEQAPVSASNAAKATDSRGDLILDGISNLRNEFDAQTGRLNDAAANWTSKEGQLFAVQVEIIKYSLLLDVTSKLTGKSTQTFDTLMKGQ